MGTQLLLALLLLPLLGRDDRNREFIATVGVALLLTVLLFGLFPAAGPWMHFGVRDPAGLSYMQQLTALRAGRVAVLRLDDLDGLVTFPSFHVAMAVLLAWAARGTGVAVAAVTLNLAMAVSTPSEGGHYLTDGIGGIAVALTAIAAVRHSRR